ncbi:MAG: hypothetical protein NTX32_05780 [Candidatus Firestonebacteria bacterium]|nr:hypothetical protein [Candidatus Firestonebacteria bacterium]
MLKRCTLSKEHCGTHIWVFADFRGGQHKGRVGSNWKGVFTRDRHPKLLAHTLRKHWKGK